MSTFFNEVCKSYDWELPFELVVVGGLLAGNLSPGICRGPAPFDIVLDSLKHCTIRSLQSFLAELRIFSNTAYHLSLLVHMR